MEAPENGGEPNWDADTLLQYAGTMAQMKEKIYTEAKTNINKAQQRDKLHYDLKHADQRVSFMQFHVSLF